MIRKLLQKVTSPAAGSGRGGTFGTPSGLPDEAPPSVDQEANWVVSGGGLAGSDPRREPSAAAGRSGRA